MTIFSFAVFVDGYVVIKGKEYLVFHYDINFHFVNKKTIFSLFKY